MKSKKIMCVLAVSILMCFGFISEIRADENDNNVTANAMGYVPSELDDNAPYAEEDDVSIANEESIPSHYMDDIDLLRSTYPPTRNQNPYGTCWAHGATACAEFSMINQGYVNAENATSLDYSELQAAYFAYHKHDDPMNGTAGDIITTNGDYLNDGYNSEGIMRTLIQWLGITDESSVPYRDAWKTRTQPLDDSTAFDMDVAHLMDTRLINIKSNRDIAKKAIMDNGALSIAFGYYDSYAKGCSYYCDKSGTNHLVSVVGWDDNYSANNFKVKPEGDGAWVCRNSWSTYPEFSINSYFYLSYYDKSLYSTAYEFVYEPAEYHDNNYQYDGGKSTGTRSRFSTVGNVFIVQGQGGADKEVLDAVSFSTTRFSNVNYEIKIYTDVDINEGPLQQNLDEDNIITGTTTTAGIYKVDLNKPIVLDRGTYFAVVVTTDKSAVDWEYGAGINKVSASRYQTIVNTGEPEKWAYSENSSGDGYGNVCIRAYTYDVDDAALGTYNIRFNSNGGQGEMAEMNNISCADSYSLSPNSYERKGYVFRNWNTKPNGTGVSYDDNQSVTGLSDYGRYINLYAQWEPIEYKIHYDANGGNGIMDDTIGVKYNELIRLPLCSYDNEDASLVFDSWNTEIDGSGIRYADGEEVSGLLDEEGTVTLYAQWGENASYYKIENNVLKKYLGSGRGIVYIPENITEIGMQAFYGHEEIIKVVLPKNLNAIGDGAFDRCINLEEVVWNSELQEIGSQAFNMTAIRSAHISNVSCLGERAFGNCSYLEEVILPEKINQDADGNAWGSSVFLSCSKLKSIKLPNGLETLRPFTFSGCSSLEEVILPDDMRYIGTSELGGNSCFNGCTSLKSLELPKMLESGYGISGLTSLTSLYVHRPAKFLQQIRGADAGLTIYGQSGTYSEHYANQYGYNFVDYYDEGIVYYIEYDPNGGNGEAYCKSAMGPTYLDSYQFSRDHYNFVGWNTKADGSGEYYSDRACVEDLAENDGDTVTLYAQWELEKYEVTLDAKGGELDTKMLSVAYNQKYGELPIPVKRGYKFKGWSYVDNAHQLIDENTVESLHENHTLYAQWEAIKIQIDFEMNIPGENLGYYRSFTLEYGDTLDFSHEAAPSYRGHRFIGWYSEAEGGELISESLLIDTEENFSIYAHWEEIPHTVKFMGGDDGSTLLYELRVLDGYSIYETEDILEIDDFTIIGDDNRQAEWLDAEGNLYNLKSPVKEDIILTADYFDAIKVGEVKCNITYGSMVESGTKLVLFCDRDADIYYTLDGSTPTRKSNKYVTPLVLKSDDGVTEITVKVIALKEKCKPSDMTELTVHVRAKETTDEIMRSDLLAEGYTGIPEGLWAHIYSSEEDLVYTGKAINPLIRVYYGKMLLDENKGYTLSYKNNVNVTKSGASVTVKCKSPFVGQATYGYMINARNIADENVVIGGGVSAYTKNKQTPSFQISYNGKKLANKTDYTIVLADNVDCIAPGKYDCIISGNNNFTGYIHADYVVSSATLMSKVTVSGIKAMDYDFGNPIRHEFTVSVGKTQIGTDKYNVSYYDNVYAGKATIVISAVNEDPTKEDDYYGSKVVTFQIKGIPLSKVKINDFVGKYVYNGGDIKQSTVLKYGDIELKENSDYSVSYVGNVNAGTAKVKYSGIGGYTGSITKTYTITPIDFTDKLTINDGEQIICDYTNQGAKPSLKVMCGETLLVEGKDYSVSCKNNTSPGTTAEFTVSGKGNYKGTYKQNFTIVKKDVVGLSLQLADVIYKEKPDAYKAPVKIYDGKHMLTAGKEYDKDSVKYTYVYRTILENNIIRKPGDEVRSDDNPQPGTRIRVTANGCGNYEGSVSGTYRIIEGDMKSATIKVEKQKYLGIEIIPEVSDISVKIGKTTLTEADYRIVYVKNNIWIGKAEMTIEGIGKYGGTKTVKYDIVK